MCIGKADEDTSEAIVAAPGNTPPDRHELMRRASDGFIRDAGGSFRHMGNCA
ncbi:MAG: hypothetical protein LBD42_07040 [Desulfovibrio sp.]|nr:hypothetical protein [Desulfovibrio sp.]